MYFYRNLPLEQHSLSETKRKKLRGTERKASRSLLNRNPKHRCVYKMGQNKHTKIKKKKKPQGLFPKIDNLRQ